MATRTLTVVFTDLVNYTQSVGRSDRQGLRDLVATHKEMVPPVLERHGGRVVKNLGDSFMALFPAATDAVRAGVDLVESIQGDDGFSIKVGIATGDVEEIDGDAFGDAVNLASRVISKTPGGEVWFSESVLFCMNQSELAWDHVGRFRLKGIVGEVSVARALPPAACVLPPPVAEAAQTRRLVRIQRGDPLPGLPPKPVILLEGFAPGSRILEDTLVRMPVVDPGALWLQAYNITPSDRHAWTKAGRGLVIGTPEAVDLAIADQMRPRAASSGSDTIILDVSGTSVLELVMAGLALPAVPMSEVVAGYSYDLLADGRWVNRSDNAVARVDVDPTGVRITALAPGIEVAGRMVAMGEGTVLRQGDQIRAPAGAITFHQIDDRGYTGLLIADTLARLGISNGQQVEIGREPNFPGMALPDRRGQDNIRWCLGTRAARARESGFTLDRALAGRRQAAVALGSGGATVLSLHDRCPTYIARDRGLAKVGVPEPVAPGDLVVTGTSVIAVREPTG